MSDVGGRLWICLDVCGCTCMCVPYTSACIHTLHTHPSLDLCQFVVICVDAHGYVLIHVMICLELCRFVCMRRDTSGCVWIRVDMCFVCVCICGCVSMRI